jgi:hypothetical protein
MFSCLSIVLDYMLSVNTAAFGRKGRAVALIKPIPLRPWINSIYATAAHVGPGSHAPRTKLLYRSIHDDRNHVQSRMAIVFNGSQVQDTFQGNGQIARLNITVDSAQGMRNTTLPSAVGPTKLSSI